jgi:hypothetical protein
VVLLPDRQDWPAEQKLYVMDDVKIMAGYQRAQKQEKEKRQR